MRKRIEQASIFLLGVIVALLSHWIDGWWLNSGSGVLRTSGGLILVGALAAVWQRQAPWAGGVAAWAGAVVGMGVVLFQIGPGTIWPLVIIIGSAITASAVLGGVLLGRGLNRFRAGVHHP